MDRRSGGGRTTPEPPRPKPIKMFFFFFCHGEPPPRSANGLLLFFFSLSFFFIFLIYYFIILCVCWHVERDKCRIPSGAKWQWQWRTVSFWMENLTEVPIWSFPKTKIPSIMRIETQVSKNKVFKIQVPIRYLTFFYYKNEVAEIIFVCFY